MRARLALSLAAVVAALVAGAVPTAAQDDPAPTTTAASGTTPLPSVAQPGEYVDELPSTDTISAAATGTTLFVGAGSSGGVQPARPVTLVSLDQFEEIVDDPSPALAGAVTQYFERGGGIATVQLTVDETAGSLLAAVFGPVAGEAGWDMLVVPAMGGLDQASWAQLGEVMGQVAANAQAVALLDPPSSVVQAGDPGWATALAAATAPLQRSPAASSMAILSSPLVVDDQTVASAAVFAGMNVAKDDEAGVWEPPGGAGQALTGMTPVVTADNDAAATLRAGGINPIMSLPTFGTVVYGDRTMSTAGGASAYLSDQRTLDMIHDSIEAGLQPVVFEPNGPATWAAADRSITAFLTTLWKLGALVGDQADEAFTVTVGAGSTPGGAAGGVMVVDVTVSFEPGQSSALQLTQQMQSAG